jgi:hypothetical protein
MKVQMQKLESDFVRQYKINHQDAEAYLCMLRELGLREKETFYWEALPYFEEEHAKIVVDLCNIIGVSATVRAYYTPSSWQTNYVQIWKKWTMTPNAKMFMRTFSRKGAEQVLKLPEVKQILAVRLALSCYATLSFSVSSDHSFRPNLRLSLSEDSDIDVWRKLMSTVFSSPFGLTNGKSIIQYQTFRDLEDLSMVGGFLPKFYVTRGVFCGIEKSWVLKRLLEFYRNKPSKWYELSSASDLRKLVEKFVIKGAPRLKIVRKRRGKKKVVP